MSVYFHGNFGLNRLRMAALLERALSNPEMRDKELAKPFDYGAPYAQRYRSWLHKTGLIEQRFPVRLTPKGEAVWRHDPKLETLTTQWFMHWELTTAPTRAEIWHWFVHEFLPGHETFSRYDLLTGVMMKLRSHSEKHFGPGSKLNPVIVRKLIECYTKHYALGELGLLKKHNDKLTWESSMRSQGPWMSVNEISQAFS